MEMPQHHICPLCLKPGPSESSDRTEGHAVFLSCRKTVSPALSDAQVVQSVIEGDPSGFSLLVHRYQRPVFSLLLQMTGRIEDAEDLAQETFLKAYRSLNLWNPRLPFGPWIYQIARNTAISSQRTKNASVISIEDIHPRGSMNFPYQKNQGDSIRELIDNAQYMERLCIAVSELSPEDAQLYKMRYVNGLSMKEIAHLTNNHAGTIAVRVHRLRERLCALLQEKEGTL